jgi:hypothetical protein
MRGKSCDLQLARGCGCSDDRRVIHHLVGHDDVEVVAFKELDKIFLLDSLDHRARSRSSIQWQPVPKQYGGRLFRPRSDATA